MRTLPSKILCATVLACVFSSVAAAEPQSAELKVLSRFVGRWHANVVSTDASGNETVTEDDATMSWVLGDSFLEDRVEDKLTGLWTFDGDQQVYRCWYFAAGSHKPLVATMRWNADDSSFAGKADLGDGITMTTQHRFPAADKYEFSVTVQDASGKVLNTLKGTKTRK